MQNKTLGNNTTTNNMRMMPMSVREVAAAVNGRLFIGGCLVKENHSVTSEKFCITNNDVVISDNDVVIYATSDSRKVVDSSIFVAIPGDRVDGHDFVQKAAELGAKIAIVEHFVKLDESNNSKIAQIVVENSVEALGLLAKHNLERRRALNTPFSIIGITGSVGKTTTKDMLKALLSTLGNTVAPIGSFNNEIGLPLTSLQVNENTRFLIAEMGANHVGEIAKLTTIAPPDLAVVLKVGVAHLGEFGSVERIAQAKSEIVRGLVAHGIAILNADDFRVSAMRSLADQDKLRWFGKNTNTEGDFDASNNGNYQLSASDISLDEMGCAEFVLNEKNEDKSKNSVRVHLAIQGQHNVMNAMAASNVARYFGMNLDSIAKVLHEVSHISPHRMQLSKISNNNNVFTLIDDSFNANPDSMKAGIDGLCSYENHDLHDLNVNAEEDLTSKKNNIFRIAVLGSMLELGSNENNMHESIGEYVAKHNIDALIAVGSKFDKKLDELAGCIYKGAKDNWQNKSLDVENGVYFVHDCTEADNVVWNLVAAHSSSVVLLKGSHASGLSVLAERWSKLNESLNEHTEVNL